jgi:hypothetical protein
MKARRYPFVLLFPSALLVACSGSSSSTPAARSTAAPSRFIPQATLSTTLAKAAARQKWNAAALQASEAAKAAAPALSLDRPSSSYPAFVVNGPQVVNQGGAPVLSHMEVATVTINNDPNAGGFETFSDGLGATDVWGSLRQYGVGGVVSRPADHVRATFPSATITDTQLDAWVTQNVAAARASGWPVNRGDQLYAIFLPTDAYALDNGDGTSTPWCDIEPGAAYHTTTYATDANGNPVGLPIPYAVLPQCTGLSFDWMTLGATHEYAEAATDPQVFQASTIAYMGFDNAHAAYGIFQALQSELGDACEMFFESDAESPPPFPFMIQRPWSNSAELAGHNPCVPAIASEPYYNTTTFAVQLDTISINWSGASLTYTCGAIPALCPAQTQGIRVPLGQSKTFEVGFYSDAPTADWTLVAVTAPDLPLPDDNGAPIANGSVSVAIDQPTGNNGHKARVTVTPQSAGPLGVEYFELQSGYSREYEARTLPVLVGQ